MPGAGKKHSVDRSTMITGSSKRQKLSTADLYAGKKRRQGIRDMTADENKTISNALNKSGASDAAHDRDMGKPSRTKQKQLGTGIVPVKNAIEAVARAESASHTEPKDLQPESDNSTGSSSGLHPPIGTRSASSITHSLNDRQDTSESIASGGDDNKKGLNAPIGTPYVLSKGALLAIKPDNKLLSAESLDGILANTGPLPTQRLGRLSFSPGNMVMMSIKDRETHTDDLYTRMIEAGALGYDFSPSGPYQPTPPRPFQSQLTRWPDVLSTSAPVWTQKVSEYDFYKLFINGPQMVEFYEGSMEWLKGYNPEVYQMPWGSEVINIKVDSIEQIVWAMRNRYWTASQSVNNRVMEAWDRKMSKGPGCFVFFLFSITGSKAYCGLAQMEGPLEPNEKVAGWKKNDCTGIIPMRFIYAKNVPFSTFEDIPNAYNGQSVLNMWNGMVIPESVNRIVIERYVKYPFQRSVMVFPPLEGPVPNFPDGTKGEGFTFNRSCGMGLFQHYIRGIRGYNPHHVQELGARQLAWRELYMKQPESPCVGRREKTVALHESTAHRSAAASTTTGSNGDAASPAVPSSPRDSVIGATSTQAKVHTASKLAPTATKSVHPPVVVKTYADIIRGQQKADIPFKQAPSGNVDKTSVTGKLVPETPIPSTPVQGNAVSNYSAQQRVSSSGLVSTDASDRVQHHVMTSEIAGPVSGEHLNDTVSTAYRDLDPVHLRGMKTFDVLSIPHATTDASQALSRPPTADDVFAETQRQAKLFPKYEAPFTSGIVQPPPGFANVAGYGQYGSFIGMHPHGNMPNDENVVPVNGRAGQFYQDIRPPPPHQLPQPPYSQPFSLQDQGMYAHHLDTFSVAGSQVKNPQAQSQVFQSPHAQSNNDSNWAPIYSTRYMGENRGGHVAPQGCGAVQTSALRTFDRYDERTDSPNSLDDFEPRHHAKAYKYYGGRHTKQTVKQHVHENPAMLEHIKVARLMEVQDGNLDHLTIAQKRAYYEMKLESLDLEEQMANLQGKLNNLRIPSQTSQHARI